MKRTIIAALVGLTLNAFAGNPFTSERYEEAFKSQTELMIKSNPSVKAIHIRENDGIITKIMIIDRKVVENHNSKTEGNTMKGFQNWLVEGITKQIMFLMCYTGHVKGHDLDWKPAFKGDRMGLGQYWLEPSKKHFTVVVIFDDGTPIVEANKARRGGEIAIKTHPIEEPVAEQDTLEDFEKKKALAKKVWEHEVSKMSQEEIEQEAKRIQAARNRYEQWRKETFGK